MLIQRHMSLTLRQAHEKLKYLELVPAVVENSISNKAYLHLQNLKEAVSVKVTLEYNTESYLLWEDTVTESHFSHCFSFTVPPAASSALAFIHLSVKGSSVSFYKRKAVAIRNITSVVFAQTDKPIYKPGQKVLFRVITLDTDLKPKNRVYPLIYIQDPQGNRVAQWLNQSATHGILQNEFQTVQDTTLGTYQLIVDNKPNFNTHHWFSMEEYVLPTFEVNLKAPQRVSAFDEELKVEICARSGPHYIDVNVNLFPKNDVEELSEQPGDLPEPCIPMASLSREKSSSECVEDAISIQDVIEIPMVFVRLLMQSRLPGWSSTNLPQFSFLSQLDKDGCASEMISTKAFRLYANLGVTPRFFVSLQVEGVVTEKGTGVQISSSSYISVYQTTKSVAFEDMDRYIKRGIPFTGKMKLRDEDGLPLANGLLFLEFDGVVLANYTTDENGTAVFSIDTSNLFEPRYKLRAYYQPDQCTDYGWLETNKPEDIYDIQRFFSRSDSYVKIEPVREELPSGKYSTFSITLNVEQKLAPRARLLVYSLQPNGDLIADTIYLEVEKCFRNKVSLEFSKKEALPASSVSLSLEATSNSFCALRAVDKEVFGYYYMGLDLDDDSKEPCIDLKNTFFDGMYYVPVNVTNDGSVYDVFQKLGLKVFTNSTLQKPIVCQSDFECKKISSDDEPDVGHLEKAVAFSSSADSVIETVTVTLEESEDFKAESLSSENKLTSLCANETKSHTWRISPQRLGTVNFTVTAEAKEGEQPVGRRDTIILPLLVEPEGIKKEVTQSSLICTKGTPISEPITLNLPENLVEGSARAVFSVLGYQRQLFFRLSDGSFSTFGSKNAEGNLWLTAMIYKAFAQSKPFIFVDDNVLSQALIWIASKQEADGCFQPQGKIYNNALKAGTDDRIIITAYVTASLMESGLLQSDPVVRRGLSCLAALSDRDFENIYVNALLAYTYSLASEVEKLNHLFDILIQSATRTGGLVYWEREKRPAAEQFSSFYPRAPSAEIETNAYILLAWLKQPNLSQENLTFASQIAQWIVRQQNFYGGFSSSQYMLRGDRAVECREKDLASNLCSAMKLTEAHLSFTVVVKAKSNIPHVLHPEFPEVVCKSLSEYGIMTFEKDAENTVDISAGESFTKQFLVNKDNSVLLQQVVLPSAQESYSVNVDGSGCAYTQANAATPVSKNTFPFAFCLMQLQNKVMRVETKNDHIFFYLEAVSAEKITFALTVEQTHVVSNIKPAQVKIYDYYETDEFAQAEYITACQQD
ncbi:hypothetical protein JD844_010057 [Phrynosoma platyrhinos]|uniref:Alpha-2-macroglobulin n=1 Tax=Phrynosoma platyrhinos TaxID=52577 RepID=A0ABQ7THP6_PHRPL|nr:hypothetical protein JD844_010057 [Phrynosoma platyrhinos]